MEGQKKSSLYTKGFQRFFHTVSISACEAAVACDVQKLRQLLWPAAGLVMLGGLVFFTCPAGAPLLCAAGRGSKKNAPYILMRLENAEGLKFLFRFRTFLLFSRLGTN